MKLMLIIIYIFLMLKPATAYDQKIVNKSCLDQINTNRSNYKLCLDKQKKAGSIIDGLSKIDNDKHHKAILANCRLLHGDSYVGWLDCIKMTLADLGELPNTLPSFNTTILCASIAENVGGSYEVQIACEKQEAEAVENLKHLTLPIDLMKICVPVASNTGGSYQILLTCIIQEAKAKAALQ
jgi:hypothetical protein